MSKVFPAYKKCPLKIPLFPKPNTSKTSITSIFRNSLENLLNKIHIW